MKILAIRIQNLASLEGDARIDFTQEPLSTAGIFAITGPTGAGKSTILDALCLALYAKTPRYKQAESGIEVKNINQGDVRGILRDGTADGLAEVDFVGIDQQHYRATWSVRRARNRTDGKLQDYDMSLENISTNVAIPGKKTELLKEIERLVGLNFEQFTRSVLLAQGDFTAFLKAGKDEKASLLEKLTGTQVYSEISIRIFERHREEAQQLRDLNLQRQGIPTLTPEELELLAAQKEELVSTTKKLEQRITQLDLEIAWYQQLHTLQKQLEAALTQHNEATAAKAEAAPCMAKLQQVERVQAVRTPVENLHITRQQQTEREEQLRQQQEMFDRLTSEQKLHDQALQQAETTLKKNTQVQEEVQPLLNSAKALDVQLAEKQKQVSQAGQDLEAARAKQQQLGATLTVKEQEVITTEKEIDRLTQWKTENSSRQAVAEHESLILSKLQDATKWVDTERDLLSRLQKIDRYTGQLQEKKATLEQQQAGLGITLQKARQEYDTTQAALATVPVQTLEQDRSRADVTVQQLTEATAHWRLLYTAQQEQERIVGKLEAQQLDLARQREQLSRTEGELEKARLQKETSWHMLEKARLAATENVEKLRTQLIPDEACPVCGSEKHPYVTDNPQLDHVLAKLDETFQHQDQVYLQLLSAQSGLQQAIIQLTGNIASLEEERTGKQKQTQSLEATWSGFDVYANCMQEPVANKTEWLQARLKQEKERQRQLHEQLRAVQQQQQQAETQRNERDRIDKQLTDIINKVKDTTRDLQSQQEQHQLHTNEFQKATDELAVIQNELIDYFGSESWFNNWKAGPEKFEKQMRNFTAEWKNNLQTLDNQLLNQKTLAVNLNGLQEQATLLAGDALQKEQHVSNLNQQYNMLDAERKQMFEGAPVSAVEKTLKEAVDEGRRVLEQCRTHMEQLRDTLTRIATEKEQNEKSIQTLQQQQARLHEQIQLWLQVYNREHEDVLTEDALAQLLDFTPAWIEDERATLRELDDALTRAQSVLKERATALEQHRQQRLPEQTVEELQRLLTEVKNNQQEYTRQQHEIDIQLRDDATNKQKIGALLKTIEEQAQRTENWAKLNEVIGSADGKKFRQVAQEYTLDVLLSYANVHLDKLSKRYLLQRISQTLGLQVVDQDMGDEVRTVFSLSGGESFLVSLALALGLASLSSNRMRVESLFIDEGFGSLDPNTLNVAMDALERLHHQGRKVGVISHVQEMTERILVQIKVSKQQSGRSRVEVIGVI
jgi:exonuclease SbcC